MASFKDSKGREWCFPEITEGTILDMRSAVGIDWHKVIDRDEAEITRAFSATGIASTLWFLLASDVEAAGLTQEDFARSLNYTAKESATKGLVESILSFYHGPENGPKMAEALLTEMKKQVNIAVAALRKQSGTLPASSG